DRYLDRIGATRPARADAAALAELQLRHLRSIPFENLSIHLGEPIELDPEALVDKLVRRRRGGFCYELNGAFAALLSALGYEVTRMAARVHGDGGLGPPFDHLALRVDTGATGEWLVDVGFGSFSHYPLRLDEQAGQADPAGSFRVTPTVDGDLEVARDGQPQYRVEIRPRLLGDFQPTCWWHQTSPASHFTQSLVCSLLTDDGRVTLSDRTLVETTGTQRHERILTDDTQVLDAYRAHFGIELDRPPPSPTR
ncbi:MAG TPA: arylamine N-acetyltransferase, partial [Actinomycetes bacterium]|nr:arylamine N-acetyltransferase [Actinomycetes bacterium]